jgi:hypothetical protein
MEVRGGAAPSRIDEAAHYPIWSRIMRAITTPAEFVRSYACAVPPTRCGKPVATLRGRIFAAARPPSARSGVARGPGFYPGSEPRAT